MATVVRREPFHLCAYGASNIVSKHVRIYFPSTIRLLTNRLASVSQFALSLTCIFWTEIALTIKNGNISSGFNFISDPIPIRRVNLNSNLDAAPTFALCLLFMLMDDAIWSMNQRVSKPGQFENLENIYPHTVAEYGEPVKSAARPNARMSSN